MSYRDDRLINLQRKRRALRPIMKVRRTLLKSEKSKSELQLAIGRNSDVYDALLNNPSIMVNITKPASHFIDDYKKDAIGNRDYILSTTLRNLSIIEGARETSKNLVSDYGFNTPIDYNLISNLVSNVAQVDMLNYTLQKSGLSLRQQAKIIEYFSEALFGPAKNRTAYADVMRNLSTPETSPFGSSALVRLGDVDKIQHSQSNKISSQHSLGDLRENVRTMIADRKERLRAKREK